MNKSAVSSGRNSSILGVQGGLPKWENVRVSGPVADNSFAALPVHPDGPSAAVDHIIQRALPGGRRLPRNRAASSRQ